MPIRALDADAALEAARARPKRSLPPSMRLPERQRAAIVLTYQEGLSNAEVAAVLDTSVSGVETLLVRAKRALRASIRRISVGETHERTI